MIWPNDTPTALEKAFGPIRLGLSGNPTEAWLRANLITFPAPYPLTLAWPPYATATRIRCHQKVAASLDKIFTAILVHYGTHEKIVQARMHLYGGCYLYRPSRGSNRLSVHAYGAAVDLDPEGNPLGKAWDGGATMMPKEVIEIFKKEGWTWGGDFTKRKDCMHFQATNG
jgi:hypothetical protein